MIKIREYSILIVEDEFIALEYLAKILSSFRIKNIFKANSAEEALITVKNHHIDLVFMDINIKGSIDGIECASLLNKEDFLPIIFSSAYGDTNTINEAKRENIFGYLIKPFQANDVEASLNVALTTIKRIKELSRTDEFPNIYNETTDLGKEHVYHFNSKTLTFRNIPISLTKKELEILEILCLNINKNISYQYFKEIIWDETSISDSTIRDLIFRLKKKIPDILIENISNYGYILKKIN